MKRRLAKKIVTMKSILWMSSGHRRAAKIKMSRYPFWFFTDWF